MREGVKFHDGSAFDAADVVATLKRQAGGPGGLARLWGQLEDVQAVDPTTVEIKLTEPVGPFLRNLSFLQIAPSEAIEAAGGEYGAAVQLPGSGPFRVASFTPGQTLALEANADYWDGAPALEGVRIVNIPELSGRITALLNDEIDVTWNIPDDQLGVLQDSNDVEVQLAPSVFYLYSWFNAGRKPFDDARVRRALWHAVDVEQVVKDLLPVTGTLAKAPIASTVFGWAEQQPYAYDPEKAKQLLAEAGYADGFSAELKYSVNFGSSIDQIAQTFSAYWSEIGVDIRPMQLEHAVFTDDFRALNWDMMMATNPTFTEDADYTLGRLYASPGGVNEENNYVNPELHEILMRARTSVDQAERAELYKRAGEIIWNDAVGIFPAELKAVYANRRDVKGLDLSAIYAPHFRNVSIAD
ncbi:ABC transporter substrate-binding protein [Chelativorans sp. J32]|uniref:ABC transporter substrate-binding protein n=1 Tax=Chelativorans sp. J32 TaxID=935840 RepID=UPI000A048509|nr:ABC transporter substrate-binding protein [Chelativorans sp. J32]